MDTTKLKVGRNVFIRNGPYGDWGKVAEVTTEGVLVQLDYDLGLIRFDKSGTACDSSDIYKGDRFWGDSKIPGTQYGPDKLYLDPLNSTNDK